MRPLILPIFPLITCVAFACGSSGDTGSTTDAQTGTGQTTSATTTSATTTDPTGPDETHASHASHADDAGSTHAASEPSTSTDAEHTTGGTTHDTHHGDSDGTGTGGGGPSAEAYCECMLVNCHDQYHGTWGEEHPASETMCAAAAAALPSAGVPVTEGDYLECRYHYCQLGHDDPAACESAIGGGACV